MVANEEAGSWPHSTAVGSGKIATGAPDAENAAGVKTGAVYVFDEKTGAFLFALHPADGAAGDRFGFAVAISGNRIAIGAPGAVLNRGSVYVYDLNLRSETLKIGTFAVAGEEFGRAVALEGDRLAVGVPLGNLGGGAESGYVYQRNVVTGAVISLSESGGGAAGDHFGESVALDGGLLAVGIPGDDALGADAGKVQLFDADSATLFSSVSPSVPQAGDGIGSDVDIEDRVLVASGSSADAFGINTGKVVTWSLGSLTSPFQIGLVNGGVVGGFMGSSISLSQGIIAVSAGRENAIAPVEVGRVRLYNRNLQLLSTVQPVALQEGGRFGSSLCLSGSTLAVAAGFEDGLAADSGALWKISPILAPSELHFEHRVAAKGDSAPGLTGKTFSGATMAAATGGLPVVLAKLTGPVPSVNAGIWRAAGVSGLWQPIKIAGLPAVGERVLKFTDLIQVGPGTFFRATYTGTGVSAANADSWLYHNGTTSLSDALRAGMTLPGGGKILKLGAARQSNHSTAATIGATLKLGPGPLTPVTPGSDSVLVVLNASALIGFQREGVSISSAGVPYGQLPPLIPTSGDKTAGIFSIVGAGVTPANNSIVDDNGIAVLGRKGDPAVDAVGAPLPAWRAFTGVARGASGVVFRGSMDTATNPEGLWSNRSGATRLVLRQGDNPLSLPFGVTIKRFVKYGMNNANTILTLVQLQGTGVNAGNDQALLACLPTGDVQLLLREGSRIPGGAKVGVIHQLDLTGIPTFSNSHYGVLVTLATEPGVTSSADNLAWLVGNAGGLSATTASTGQLTIQLRKGLQYSDVPGRDKITSFKTGVKTEEATGAFNTGLSHVLGQNFGQSTLIATHPDKSTSVVCIDY
jgi:hypothetical protein